MFFMCELKKLRKLKALLLSRYRSEQILASLPDQLGYRIEKSEEAAAVKLAEENLETEKKIDVANRKKRLKTTTIVTAIVSLVATLAVALVLALSPAFIALVVAGGTLLLTLVIHLIAKSIIKKSHAKNHAEIFACEEALAQAKDNFEVAKVRIELEINQQIDFYENLLNNPETGIIARINNSTIVHDDDKDYNTVCQIIWCFEHKYACSIKEAKQWIARAKHSKYVRGKLIQLSLGSKDEHDIEINATEGQEFPEEIPQANIAKG